MPKQTRDPSNSSGSSPPSKKARTEDGESTSTQQEKSEPKYTADELYKKTVKELKQLCIEENLLRDGNKTTLIHRLLNPDDPKNQKRGKRSAGTTSNKPKRMMLGTVEKMIEKMGYRGNASKCAMAGIARGFFQVDKDGTLDQVVYRVNCRECREEVAVTLQNILEQPDYGGDDYEEGSEGGAVHCPNGDCDRYFYITSMCTGNLSLDSGKFHNHCTECRGFGKCIGDYRNRHCETCGSHYFCGLSGFDCPRCSRDAERAEDCVVM